ncbi:MAG: divalent-cation tolerance protein CutA [Candidatus Nealsonbacteria bacterium CG02_land_8_20_14_3_00_40_11]|uniref:Divalent-cation tolerance protein CutA n=1 Tax=Candidatus Nealsonbacteria bacterium CG02_land_8_20_14_3_00_40_11 TaxID=1974700 RepID=A0A2M7D7V2_9BACT|nr:MAG: divalent-cation tolerance protein CutA [Candidatus Nealsonbacteria bacterium CG02_land_8_20_14_3_00_40_11]
MIFIYSTFPNMKEAKEIGERLIKNKLAACINIFPIDSIYNWRKKIIRDKEFAAIIKTKKQNFKKIEKFILENHSYDTPCIVEIPLGRVNKKYLDWLNKNT